MVVVVVVVMVVVVVAAGAGGGGTGGGSCGGQGYRWHGERARVAKVAWKCTRGGARGDAQLFVRVNHINIS